VKSLPMSMADLKRLEFHLLRYVPHLVSGQFVDIGVLLFEPQPNGFGYADVRVTSDWDRVYRLDKEVDIEVLQDLEPYIRMQLRHSQDVALLVRKFEESFANMVQLSPRQVCLAAEPSVELESLSSIYLKEPWLEAFPPATRQKGEHAVIHARIKDAFTRAGIWALCMEHISAGQYTKKKGDPLFFDFGYVVGSEVRFFQSVPLRTNANQTLAVNLASRFPKIAECIYNETQASTQLTAVFADNLDRTSPEIDFVLGVFKENKVELATTSDMPSIAENVRQALKV
jgi:hypothetical protein